MASITSSSNQNQKSLLIEKRPLMMLKDYLRDDFSSCSSNGFKSFPRRKCCTTVRFLLEIDLNTSSKQRSFKRSTSSNKAASSTISALQKASEAVINAVKLLPFPSSSFSASSFIKSSSPSAHNNRSRKRVLILPRSLSRKLFNKSFWKKADHGERESSEIRRWKLFREFLEEKYKPSNHNSTAIFTSRLSASSPSGNSKSNSWTGSEFTGHGSYSESYSSRNAAAEGEKDLPSEKKASVGVGVIVGEHSITYSTENTKECPNEEDKEQFSPVSVLDCTFQDEEVPSSPFLPSLLNKGTKQKFKAKIRKFESVAEIEPINLEKQIESAELEDEPRQSTIQVCTTSIHNNKKSKIFNDFNEDPKGTETCADELLKLVKAKTPLNRLTFKADCILLDFSKEKIIENNAKECKQFEKELEIAQEWINGRPEELFLGWEVKENKPVYIREMERDGKWRNLDEDKEELASELELQVYTSLVNEALLDLLR